MRVEIRRSGIGGCGFILVCIGENDPVDCFLVLQEISLELLVFKKDRVELLNLMWHNLR